MAKGTKRASPGADDEKDPLQAVELDEASALKLNANQQETQRIELHLDKLSHKLHEPVFAKRREIAKGIAKFWPIALMNSPAVQIHCQHNSDQLALSYLEDLWVVRDPVEFRCYTIEFYFKENPHFTDRVLKKEYAYAPKTEDGEKPDTTPDENGISQAMLDFSWETDVKPSAIKINWKDPAKALTKLYPREAGTEGDDEPAEPGSFFNFFEVEADPYDVGLAIATEVFPDAVDYFLGHGMGDDDSDIDSDEDEDDDAEEIDLEKPKTKKQKV